MSASKDNTPPAYETVPGRGLVTKSAIKIRLEYLVKNGFELDHISRYFLDHNNIQNNIESFIGTVEIPLGIAGPLLFCDANGEEFVYTAAGTLEGALVASMNRGAKAISLSKGFTAKVLRQKMIRAPLFFLKSVSDARTFEKWVSKQFTAVKDITEKYSNHAKLISLTTHSFVCDVHVKFVYTTGDAAGQNMTTTCTWHGMLWIVENFLKETGIEIPHYVIEGNGSSDKKVSQFLLDHGRGTAVVAECFLEEGVIRKILRTTSEDIFRCYSPSVEMSKKDGMIGYNINVANTIAAIFVATGQDLASIHESSIGILHAEKKPGGLAFQLMLPSLVIGTVGGGTDVPDQNEGLKIMDCAGTAKVERFAKLISGFALALEISTCSAIASGEFAKAHERLGRNKPVSWLLKDELNGSFLKNCLNKNLKTIVIRDIVIHKGTVENGILTNITQRVNKKITGFIPITILLEDGRNEEVLIKSKALDLEVIKGLHLMAASIDPKLSDLIYQARENLEYWNCHLKELNIYSLLAENGFDATPRFYGKYIDEVREVYFLFIEKLDRDELMQIDSENSPKLWTDELIKNAIREIHHLHFFFWDKKVQERLPGMITFEPWRSKALYTKIASIVCSENEEPLYQCLQPYLDGLEEEAKKLQLPLTIIHNDFNPRNVAIRKNGRPCIYDWELAVKNIPHRDIVELLCFVMPLDFDTTRFTDLLQFHFEVAAQQFGVPDREKWKQGYVYALKEFLVARAAYYKAGEILFQLKFADRIMLNAIRMIGILEN